MAKTYYLTFGVGDPRQYAGLAPTFLIFNNNGSAVTPPSISAVAGATGFYSFTWGTTTPIAFLADAATTSPGSNARYVWGALDPADRADEYAATMIALGSTITAQVTNQGATLVAFGNTSVAIGTTSVAIGTTNAASISNLGSTLTSIGNTQFAYGATLTAQMLNMGATLSTLGGTLTGLLGTSASSIGSTSIDPTTVFGFLMRAQELAEGNQTYTKSTGVLDLYSRGSSTLLREKTIADSSTSTTKT